MHTSRLREKNLATGSDLVSTHRGKVAVLVFNKDTGEALSTLPLDVKILRHAQQLQHLTQAKQSTQNAIRNQLF